MLSFETLGTVAYPGFQREGCLRSGPIQKVGGGGGGGGGGRFRSDIRKVGTAWKLAPHSSAPHSKMNKLSIPHAARAFNIVTSIICKRKQTQYKTKLL